MNTAVKNTGPYDKIFDVNAGSFTSVALEIFRFQYNNNAVYQQFCKTLNVEPGTIDKLEKIPFLPISLFKTHKVVTTDFEPAVIFESSGTTTTINSQHLVKDLSLYEKSFNDAFRLFYGDPKDLCIIGLLPSYLERNNSSLVMMVEKLIEQSEQPKSGFYLNDFQQLQHTLQALEARQQRTVLIGVTFALLDFAEQFPMPLRYTSIMETGGMKGRREEMTREKVHGILCGAFGQTHIHSEYGMTELLSQGYSKGDGIFDCPPWMKILLREEDDPLSVQQYNDQQIISGAVNVIDLANIYSCSFIATDDAAKLHPGGSFEILGRLDNSDIRGCSLLSL